MYKIYVASLDDHSLYAESKHKQDLINAFLSFTKEHGVFIIDFRDPDGNQLRDELKQYDYKEESLRDFLD